VVRGLTEVVQSVIDAGTARTAGDALRMRGEGSYTSLAAAARIAIIYTQLGNADTTGLRPTHSEILDFIDSNLDLKSAVDMAASYRNAIDMPVSVLGLSCWILGRVDPDAAERFMSTLAAKTDLRAGDAILALLNRLTEVRRNGRLVTRNDYLSLVFRAWNYWRAGQKVNALLLRTRDGANVAVPEPK